MAKVRRFSWVAAVALMALGAVPAYGQRVKVERAPIVVERRQFDPANPPPEMPKLGPEDDAITEYRFSCESDVATTVLNQRRVGASGASGPTSRSATARRGAATATDDAGYVATVRVESITLLLRLTA